MERARDRRLRGGAWVGRALGSFGAAALAALVLVAVDATSRLRFGAHGRIGHLAHAAAVLVALAVPAGLLLTLLELAAQAVTSRGPRRRRELARALLEGAAVGAMVAVPLRGLAAGRLLSVVSPSGARIALFSGLAVAAAWLLGARLLRGRSRGVRVAVLSAAGALLLAIDARVAVGTHTSAHLALVTLGALLFYASVRAAAAAPALRRTAIVAGAVSAAWALALGALPRARARVLSGLTHLSQDPSTLGTVYARVVAPRVASPPPPPAPPHPEVEDPWVVGEREPEDEAAAAASLRQRCADCNILVYFVDTLRADVASDASVMPTVSQFARESIDYRRAYSTASDTLRALPALLGGRYDERPSPTLLEQVRAAGLDNALFVPRSAERFLSPQLPAFRFDEVATVADHPDDVEVWGYGADRPTGDALADRFAAWARARRDRRFFAWIYNYDLHAWRQIRDEHLSRHDRRVSAEERPDLRYRAVARMVDRSFRRVLRGLAKSGLAERTVVVFVSDHGEALGYRGFTTHSSFLWQPLVRVPLVVRVPGVAPRVVERDVSLVDVAPTLARFVDPRVVARDYHGMDLLRFHVTREPTRTLPILLRATSEGRPSYVGVVTSSRKLVVGASGGQPQLHDLDDHDPDETDLYGAEPERASALERTLYSSPFAPTGG